MRSTARLPLLLLTLAATVASGTAQIRWSSSLGAALEQARTDESIVLIAIVMPGERASDALEKVHYKDKRLGELSSHTANVLIRVGPLVDYDADERVVRDRYLKVGPEDPVAAPHHLFVKPHGDGELISSVAYAVTPGQLEWLWVDSLRKVRPDFAWELGRGARAPEGMRLDGAESGRDGEEPPSKEQVEAALSELKKSSRWQDWPKRLENLRIVLRSPEPAALKYAETNLRSLGRGRFAGRALREIGEVSPEVWWKVVADYIDDRADEIREESARALEQLRAKKSLSALKKAWKAEKVEAVQARILRALAAVGPTDSSVSKIIAKVLEKEKSPALRAQAVAAASVLENPEAVRAHIEKALADDHRDVRTAAAFAIASRRDPELADLLEQAGRTETDLEAKRWFEIATTVTAGGDLREFEPFTEKVLGDRSERQSWDPGEMFGGRGRDGDDDGRQPRRGR